MSQSLRNRQAKAQDHKQKLRVFHFTAPFPENIWQRGVPIRFPKIRKRRHSRAAGRGLNVQPLCLLTHNVIRTVRHAPGPTRKTNGKEQLLNLEIRADEDCSKWILSGEANVHGEVRNRFSDSSFQSTEVDSRWALHKSKTDRSNESLFLSTKKDPRNSHETSPCYFVDHFAVACSYRWEVFGLLCMLPDLQLTGIDHRIAIREYVQSDLVLLDF